MALLLVLVLLFGLAPHARGQIPPCITNVSDLVYINGALSAGDTFKHCLENVPDPKLIPILYNGTYLGPLQVQAALQMNQVQDVSQSFSQPNNYSTPTAQSTGK
ncbi:hypothetical protein B484DRAFT_73153 [Ochromonadaceae sp. CCMP2298]|nr:hypothetical protein B484DRAFT_73153 [Ochromonadaceae sp. CCMP2298]